MTRPTDPDRKFTLSHSVGRPVDRGGRAVVGFDDTTASRNALAYAIGWGLRVGGQLDVLHVLQDDWRWAVDTCVATYATITAPSWDDDLCDVVSDMLTGAGPAWSYHTVRGGVAQALEQHAERVGADVIIVGRPRGYRLRPMWTAVGHRLMSCSNRIIVVVP